MKKYLAVFCFLFGLSSSASANTISITSSTNWSSITTGSGTSGAPAAADFVRVNYGATLTVDVTNAVCGALQLGDGFTATNGTLTFTSSGSPALIVTSSGGQAGTIQVSGTGITGTLTMVSGASLTAVGMTNGGGTANFNVSTGTIIFTGTSTIPSGATSFNNLTINASGNTVTLGATITVSGNLNITAGTLDVSTGNYGITLTSASTTFTNNGTFIPRSGTFTFNHGSQTNTINGFSTTSFYNLSASTALLVNTSITIASGGTLSLSGNGDIAPGATVTIGGAGTLSGSGMIEVTATGNTDDYATQYPITNKTLSSISVEFDGSGPQTLKTAIAPTEIYINNSSSTVTYGVSIGAVIEYVYAGSNLVVGPAYTVGGTVMGAGTITVTHTGSANDLTAQYTAGLSISSMTINYAGTAVQNLNSMLIVAGVIITNTTGVNFNSTESFTTTVNGLLTVGASYTLGGTLTGTNGTIVVTHTGGANDLTAQYTGTLTLTGLNINFSGAASQSLNATISPKGFIITNASGTTFSASETPGANGTALNTGGLLIVGSAYTLSGPVAGTGGRIMVTHTGSGNNDLTAQYTGTLTLTNIVINYNGTAAQYLNATLSPLGFVIANGYGVNFNANETPGANGTIVYAAGSLIVGVTNTLSGPLTGNGTIQVSHYGATTDDLAAQYTGTLTTTGLKIIYNNFTYPTGQKIGTSMTCRYLSNISGGITLYVNSNITVSDTIYLGGGAILSPASTNKITAGYLLGGGTIMISHSGDPTDDFTAQYKLTGMYLTSTTIQFNGTAPQILGTVLNPWAFVAGGSNVNVTFNANETPGAGQVTFLNSTLTVGAAYVLTSTVSAVNGTIVVTHTGSANDLTAQYTGNVSMTNLTLKFAGASAQNLNTVISPQSFVIANSSGVNFNASETPGGTVVNAGGILIVGSAYTLSGTLSGNGTIQVTHTGGSNDLTAQYTGTLTTSGLKIITNGSSAQTITTALTCRDLQTSVSLAMNANLTVTDSLFLSTAGPLIPGSANTISAGLLYGNPNATIWLTHTGSANDFTSQFTGTTNLANITVYFAGSAVQNLNTNINPYGFGISNGNGVNFNANETPGSGGTNVMGPLTVGAAYTLSGPVTGSSTITVTHTGSANDLSAQYTGTITWTNLSVNFGGVSAQNLNAVISPVGFIISNTSGVTFNATETPGTSGTTVNSGASLTVGAAYTLGGVVTGTGTIVVTHTGSVANDFIAQYTGTVTLTNLTVNFNGASAQNLNTVISPLGFIISNTSGVLFTASETPGANGTTVNGLLNLGSPYTLSGPVTGTGGTIIVSHTGSSNDLTSQYTGALTLTNLNINFTGAATQNLNSNISPLGFIISNTLGVVFNAFESPGANGTTVNGTLTVAGPYLLSGALTGTGTIVVPHVGASTSDLTTQYTGTLTLTNMTVNFTGSAAQKTGAISCANLILNNSTGLTLTGNATIGSTLTLTSGKITTGTYKVIISSVNAIAGVSSSNYIVGNLQQHIVSQSSLAFPIGDASNYTPITIGFNTISSAGDITASCTAGSMPTDFSYAPISKTGYVNRYWTITNSGVAATSFSSVFNFVSGDVQGGANTSNFVVASEASGVWTANTVTSATSTSITATNISHFSSWVVGLPGPATIEIFSNTNWSSITGGSGPGGLPSASDVIIIDNGATLTVDGTADVCKDIQIGSSTAAHPGNGTLVFASTGSPVLTATGTITIAPTGLTGTLTMASGATLISNIIAYGGGTGNENLNAGNVTYTGSFTLPPTFTNTYNNLTITGALITTNSMTVNGTLTVNAGASFAPTYLSTISGGSLTGNGTITVNHHGSANDLTAQYTLSITTSGLHIIFSGATGQYINGTLSARDIEVATTTTLFVNGTVSATDSLYIHGTFATITPGASNTITAGQMVGSGQIDVTYTGSATNDYTAQYIITTPTLTNLTINFAGASAQNVNTVLSPLEFIIANASGVNFNASETPGANGTIVNAGAKLIVGSAYTLSGALKGNGTIQVTSTGATNDLTNQYTGTLTTTGLLIYFNGTSPQKINASTLNARSIEIGNTLTAKANIAATDSVWLASGSVLIPGQTNTVTAGQMTGFGQFEVTSTGSSTDDYAAQYIITTPTYANLTVNFAGLGGQKTATALSCGFLTISNTSAAVAINANISVSYIFNILSGAVLIPGISNTMGGSGTLSGNGTIQVTAAGNTNDFTTQYPISNKTLTNLTIDFEGASSQAVNTALSPLGFIITNTSGVNFNASETPGSNGTTVNGTLTVGAAYTLSGAVTGTNGTIVITHSGSSTNDLIAQYTGTLTLTNLTVNFAGTAAQTLNAAISPLGIIVSNHQAVLNIKTNMAATTNGTKLYSGSYMTVAAAYTYADAVSGNGTIGITHTGGPNDLTAQYTGTLTTSGLYLVYNGSSQFLNVALSCRGIEVMNTLTTSANITATDSIWLPMTTSILVPGSTNTLTGGQLTGFGTIDISHTGSSTDDYAAQYIVGSADFTNLSMSFTGSAAQKAGTISCAYLTLNNSAGLTIGGNATANTKLILTSGKITTGANKVINNSTSSIAGASSSNYIVGNLQQHVVSQSTIDYPVGDATNYTPVTIGFNAISNPGDITVACTAGSMPTDFSYAPISKTGYVNRYWTITNSGVAASSYSSIFNFVSGDIQGGANPSNFVVASEAAGSWTANTVTSATSTSITATNISHFSSWIVGLPGPATLEIFSNTNWSTITGGSGPGGLPSASDVIIIDNGATLTVDGTADVCKDIQIGSSTAPHPGNGSLVFTGSGNQAIVSDSVIQGDGTNTGALNLTNGYLAVQALVYNGGTYTSGGTIEFTGNNSLPTHYSSFGNLKITGGTTTIGAASSITGTLTLNGGTLAAGSYLTMGSSSAILRTNTGSMTGTLQGSNAYDVTYTGTAQTTGSELNGAGLRNVSENLSSGNALTLNNSITMTGDLAIGTGTFAAGSNTINIAGNITGTGSNFSAGTSTVNFNSSSAQTSVGMSFYNLTLNGAGGLTPGGATTILSGGTLTLINGILNVGTNLTMGSGSYIARSGGILSGTLQGSNPYDVTYTGASMTTGAELLGTGLRNVTVNLTTSNTLTQNATYTMSGTLTLTSGTLTVGSHTISLQGNLVNNSVLNAALSTVTFNGAASQTISGSAAISFYNLAINNASGIVLGTNNSNAITVLNTLTATAGSITTGANTLIISQGGSTSGLNSSKFIVGNLEQYFSTGSNVSQVFPVGNSGQYAPVTITFPNVTTAGYVTINTTAADDPQLGSSCINSTKSVNRYWTLSVPAGTPVAPMNYNASATYLSSDLDAGTDTSKLASLVNLGSTWYSPTNTRGNGVYTVITNGVFRKGNIDFGDPVATLISFQPVSASACTSANASFSVTASGCLLSYQWQESQNGGTSWNNLGNAGIYSNVTTSTLNLTGVTSIMNNYQYRCIISSSLNVPVNSSAAILTVNSLSAASVNSQTVCSGSVAAMTVSTTTTGTATLSYQWLVSTNGGTTYNTLPGATNVSYSITATGSLDNNLYECVVTPTGCSALTSTVGALSVNTPPSITNQPGASTICAGLNTSFSVSATGTALAYQWQENNGTSWTDLSNGGIYSGTTTTTLSLTGVSSSNNGFGYRVIISGTCSPNDTSSVGNLTINNAPAITNQPGASTICAGLNASFSVAATGTTLAYQWQENNGSTWTNLTNGGIYSGATSSTLSLTGVSATNNGFGYRVIISGTCSPNDTSSAAILTINKAPAISSQPIASTICAGLNTSFSVSATGTALAYQWQENNGSTWANLTNGGIYSGTTTSTLSLTGVTSANNGFGYRVIISGACSPSDTSSTATLIINNAPSITNQPSASTICAGLNTNFSVSATGTALAYQWQENNGSSWTSLVNGGIYSGTTSSMLSLTGVSTTNNGFGYRVIISGTCSPNDTSSTATLIINKAPAISSQPIASTICAGLNTNFSVSATGTALAYQWQENNGSTWTSLINGGIYSGANTSTLSLTGVSATNNGFGYRVIISGTCSPNDTSSVGTLTINKAPAITSQPSASTICAGLNTSFSVSATGTALAYQWQENNGTSWTNLSNGGIYSGTTTATLSLTGLSSSNNGFGYRVIISGTCAPNDTSSPATLTINNAPSISSQPSASTICAGLNTSFSVSATGTALAYQWQENNGSTWANLTKGGIYSGTTTFTLSLTGVTSANNGFGYRVIISGTCSPNDTSSAATLMINNAPSITNQPSASTICAGLNTSFSVSATGTALAYQWQENNGSTWTNLKNGGIYSGATTSTLSLTGVSATNNGFGYRVIISGTCAPNDTSSVGTLTINNAPSITSQPSASTICAGLNTSFSVAATGAALAYQWQENNGSTWANLTNGGIYSGTTTFTLSLTGVTSANNGFGYRVIISGTCAPNDTSSSATLAINATPSIISQPSNNTVYAGATVSYSIIATGPSLIFKWQESRDGGTTWNNLSSAGIYSNTDSSTLQITNVNTGMNGYQYRCLVTGICNPSMLSGNALLNITSFNLNLKAFLMGPYNSGTGLMNTNLNTASKHLIPLKQPYCVSPWNYHGSLKGAEQVTTNFLATHTNIVDWVLIELRSGLASSTIVQKRAAFLLNDGTIVDTDGTSPVAFDSSSIVSGNSYYIVIKHRNHLSIMTATPQLINQGQLSYDFSFGLGQVRGSDMALLATGVYGLYACDANADGVVNNTDNNNYWFVENPAINVYKPGDFNLDGMVNNVDRNSYFLIVNPKLSHVPN